jgi:hypothetical protein
MLPHSYQVPAELLLILSGALACFCGYRLFRVVLVLYGFIIGGMLVSSMMGVSNTAGMVAAAIGGGLAGALVLLFAYFLGIALVGAGLGAAVAHLGWKYLQTGEPPPMLVIGLAAFGVLFAMLLRRHVIVVATAFGGAWTMIVGWLALESARAPVRSPALAVADVWIFYPMAPSARPDWVPIAWLVLGSFGTAVQLGVTARKR